MDQWTCGCGRRNRAAATNCGNCRTARGEAVVHPRDEEQAEELLQRESIRLSRHYGQPVRLVIVGKGRPLTLVEAQVLVRETEADLKDSITPGIPTIGEPEYWYGRGCGRARGERDLGPGVSG